MTKRTLVGFLIVAIAHATSAQSGAPAAAQTAAAQCQLDATSYQSKKFADLRATGQRLTADMVNPIRVEARRVARECADKIAPATASAAELTALASLYLFTTDTAKAQNAVALALAKPEMTEAEHADALFAAEQLSIATFDPFVGLNPGAEKFVSEIDALSEAVLAQKVRAHEELLGRYDYADFDDGVRGQAHWLLDLGKHALSTNALGMTTARAGAPSVNAAYPVIADAYSSLARAAGDFLHADSALLILDEAYRVLGPVFPDVHRYLDGQRDMYRLVGTKATPIDGKWWINAENGSSVMPGDGKVTFIQFTAHWCKPCKHSYPAMLNMAKHFAGKPVESIMETSLYGFIGSKANLTPEEEVAEDRDYYTKEHGLPFKIAINPQLARGDSLTKDDERRYAVGGFPEIIVVDRNGIIRATVVGWDNGNEKRLTAFIDRILTEK